MSDWRFALCVALVERNGEQLVAEVKTGSAADLSRCETGRQLLECQLATGSRCVLLVDPEAETITEVGFRIARPLNAPSAWPTVLVVAAIAACAYWWLLTGH